MAILANKIGRSLQVQKPPVSFLFNLPGTDLKCDQNWVYPSLDRTMEAIGGNKSAVDSSELRAKLERTREAFLELRAYCTSLAFETLLKERTLSENDSDMSLTMTSKDLEMDFEQLAEGRQSLREKLRQAFSEQADEDSDSDYSHRSDEWELE